MIAFSIGFGDIRTIASSRAFPFSSCTSPHWHPGRQAPELIRWIKPPFSLATPSSVIAGRSLDRFRAPIGAHVREHLRAVGQQLHEQHAEAVERIVFGGKDVRLTRAVPVEGRVEHRLREVAVGIEIRPLALSLEAGRDGVVADHFFLAARRAGSCCRSSGP